MKALILTILFFIISYLAYSQRQVSNDSIVRQIINDIHAKGIDTIFIYKDYCDNCIYPKNNYKKCENPILNNSHYIFWLKEGETYFLVIDDCYYYSAIPSDSNLFKFIYSVKDSLINCTLTKPSIGYSHSGRFLFVFVDKHNDFEIIFDNDYFYNEPNSSKLNPNNKTIVKSFRDSIHNYYQPDLIDRIKLTRKKKNYR